MRPLGPFAEIKLRQGFALAKSFKLFQGECSAQACLSIAEPQNKATKLQNRWAIA